MAKHHQVLYRKYRPQSFEEIIGQEQVVRVLNNSLKQGRIAHAYLFSGPRGVGKTTIARLVAKSVNCEANNSTGKSLTSILKENPLASGVFEGKIPCNICESCSEFNAGSSFNLIEIDAASNRGIDEVRELRESIRFVPSRGKYKVYVIDECHQLTKDAFNALLKTLEEPPEHAIFILATTELDKVPATITSRTQQFDFRRPSGKDIKNKLVKICGMERINFEDGALETIALIAEGSMRDAESVLGRILAVADENITAEAIYKTLGLPKKEYIRDFFSCLASNEKGKALSLISEMTKEGYDTQYIVKILLRYFRNSMLLKTDMELETILLEEETQDDLNFLKSRLALFSNERLTNGIRMFLETRELLKKSPIPQLPLEMAVYELTNNQQPTTNN